MVIWGFIFLLLAAVVFLIWLQFRSQAEQGFDVEHQQQLESKVVHLEENLKKTLEIMQDLAKKMHVQQEVLDQTTHKVQQMELQQAELIQVLAKAVRPPNAS